MSSERTSARLIGAVVASLLVHSVVAAVLPSRLRARVVVASRPTAEVEFQVLEPPPPSEAVVEPPPPIEPIPPIEPMPTASLRPSFDPSPVEPRTERAVEAPSEAVTVSPSTTTPGPTHDSEERPVPGEEPITVPGGLRIDPRAVALGAVGAGPRIAAPQAVEGPVGETAEARDARLGEQHSRFLASAGNRRDYVTRRGPPDLRRRPDGSFVYTGSAFSARILPDGTVQFSDRNNVRFGDFGGPANSLGATVRFDVTDALERRAGNDPYQAERRWFLEETESLRERLGTEHRTQTSASEERSLRGRLERIWSDASKPTSRRRTSLFRIWDDLTEDETGTPMRRIVLTFIRTRLPAGSPDAYTPEELAALNGGRQSREAFAPY